ncbi:MAG: hypothetical protein GY854_31845 [Deltaproteobacteria bacterium]|nr:hypothetical protein [Deltaproteobacteria bacterium]
MKNKAAKNDARLGNDLFAIDVDAEIRKLVERRFKVSGEAVAELVSFAASLGPKRIEILLGRRQLKICCPEATLDDALLDRLILIFDPARAKTERHLAMVELEKRYGLEFLAAFAGQPSRVAIEWTAGDRVRGIAFSPGSSPRAYTPSRSKGVIITVSGPRGGLKKEKRVIERHCRYADVPVYLNRTEVSGGLNLDDCLIQESFARPGARGVIGVPSEGDLLRITRLVSGVVKEEVVLPSRGGFVVNVAVETNRKLSTITDILNDMGSRLYAKLAASYNDRGDVRGRILELLFDRWGHRGGEQLLHGVKAFPQADGPPLDLDAVREAAKEGPIYAIDRDTPSAAYEIGDRPVLLLDRHQRRFLDHDLRIPLVTPPQRARFSTLRTRLGSRLRSAVEQVGHLLGGGPAQPIPDDQLDSKERAFLDAARSEISSGGFVLDREDNRDPDEICMATGGKRPWILVRDHDGQDVLRIARTHRIVKGMVAAFDRDPSYLYPALVALTDGSGKSRN